MSQNPGSVVLLLLVGAPGLTSLLVLLTVLFPGTIRRAQRAVGEMPGRSLLLGIVNLLFLIALVLVLSSAGERSGGGRGLLGALAIPPGLALIAGLLLGMACISALVGERLSPERGAVSQAVIGAASLVLASLTPFLGWFLFFPYAALVGLGGLVIGLFSRPSGSE